jgi:hypothetical protein
MHKIYLCQSFMHWWEPTECLGIQILTIKLLSVISIVFGFFGIPCRHTEYDVIMQKEQKKWPRAAEASVSLYCSSHIMMSYCVSITEQTKLKSYLFFLYNKKRTPKLNW